MPPSSRIPPLLKPFVRTPDDDSLLLLTSTLEASASWLIARFLCDALSPGDRSCGDQGAASGAKKVLLVSWMRDHDFWRHEVRKATGLDLATLRAQGSFAFVDGLSALCLPASNDNAAVGQRPGNYPTEPRRMPALRSSEALPDRAPQPGTLPPRAPTSPPGLYTLSSASLDELNAATGAALAFLRPSSGATSTLIILDNPDLLLACVPIPTHFELASFFQTLHKHANVSHVLVHLHSDMSLLAPSASPQPLQIAQQNLVIKTAHMSDKVLGVRLLDTGVAKDVSGVLRATINGHSWATIGTMSEGGHVEDPEQQGLEVLYKIHGDGSVRVFERGAEVTV